MTGRPPTSRAATPDPALPGEVRLVERAARAALPLVLALVLVVLLQFAHERSVFGNEVQSDFRRHIGWAERPATFPAHSAFHAATWVLSRAGGLDPRLAGALVTWLAVLTLALLYREYAQRRSCGETGRHVGVIVLLTLLHGPFLPVRGPSEALSSNLYLGVWTAAWHNPTSLVLKPIAFGSLLAFFALWRAEQRRGAAQLGGGAGLLALLPLSVLAKPSFAISFLPGAGLALAVARSWRSLVWVGVAGALCGGLLLHQGSLALAGRNRILVDPLASWGLYTESVTLSILQGNAFVLAYLLIARFRTSRESAAVLAMHGASLLYLLLLKESARADAVNFGWSYVVTLELALFFVLCDYFRRYSERRRWERIALNSVAGVQLFFGFAYLLKLLVSADGRTSFA